MIMRKLLPSGFVFLLLLAPAAVTHASGVDAKEVFEHLKSMSGTWRGPMEGEGGEAEKEAAAMREAVHEFQVSAAGTVVMETMAPGSEHEMINMYHLDGEELVLTHYCAGGNQPTMRLNRGSSTKNVLLFDFTGGSNLDPAVDEHIHSAELHLVDGDHVESIWKAHAGGKQAGVMTFHLARSE